MSNGNEETLLPPFKKKHRSKVKISPPLLPLIDVMFTLLMFFLVAARAITTEGMLPSNLPEVGKSNMTAVAVRISLVSDAAGRPAVYQVEGESRREFQTAEQLHVYLEEIKKRLGPDTPIKISPQSLVRWEDVVNAFNQAQRVQFKKVGFERFNG
jgi:biopolymer transport protein ExbD